MSVSIFQITPGDFSRDDILRLQRSVLSPAERELCETHLTWEGRNTEFTLGRALLRFSFARLYGQSAAPWTIGKTKTGQPVIEEVEHAPNFSLTHTGGAILCALSGTMRVGLDVERLDRTASIENVKSRVFSSPELVALEGVGGDARSLQLLRLWTGKEAYTKAHGLGMNARFDQITIDARLTPARLVEDLPVGGDPENWSFSEWRLNNLHFVSLAVEALQMPDISWEKPGRDDLLQFVGV